MPEVELTAVKPFQGSGRFLLQVNTQNNPEADLCPCKHIILLAMSHLACSLQFSVLWCVCIRMSVGSLVGELTTDVNSTVEHLRELGEMTSFPGPTHHYCNQ